MAWVSSAQQGLDILHSIVVDMLPDIGRQFGYPPQLVWNKGQMLKKPPVERIWMMVKNMFQPDRQENIGRPRRYVVLGEYRVVLFYPKLGLQERKVDVVAEMIKTALRYQRRLSPYNIRGGVVNYGEPYQDWNTKYVSTLYRFQYFVA